MPRTDDDWVADLRSEAARDPAAAELSDFLRRTLARGFGRQFSDADLDDLAQDGVIRVVNRLDDFRGASRFTTWAASIAVNGALGELRKRKFRSVSLDDAVAAGGAALEEVSDAPDRLQRVALGRELRRSIDEALTENQRDALLAELGGLPLMEIARRAGRKRGAVYKMLHDARKRLKADLEARGISIDDLAEGGATA